MHVHLAGDGNALDWNMFPSPSVSAFCICLQLILLEKFKLDEIGILITADVILSFLPLVLYGHLFFFFHLTVSGFRLPKVYFFYKDMVMHSGFQS